MVRFFVLVLADGDWRLAGNVLAIDLSDAWCEAWRSYCQDVHDLYARVRVVPAWRVVPA